MNIEYVKFLTIAVIAVAAFIINYNTPLMIEDLIYTLKADKNLAYNMNVFIYPTCDMLSEYDQVKDIPDIIESQYWHYNYANGRLLPHFTSQLFGAILGKNLFNLCNVCLFLLFGMIIALFAVRKSIKKTFAYWCISIVSIWYLLRETHSCYFVMTYALNYLWSSVFCLIFLYVYIYKQNWFDKRWKIFLFCFFSFTTGWSHEGMSVGIAGAVCIDCLINFKRKKLSKTKLLFALCFCFGTALLCFAPGNFTRTDTEMVHYNPLSPFRRLRLFYLMIAVFLIFNRSKKFLLANRVLVLALFFHICFMLIASNSNPKVLWSTRVFWSTELFSLLLSIMMIARIKCPSNILNSVSWLAIIILIFHMAYCAYYSKIVRLQYDDITKLYMKSSDGVIYYDLHKFPSFVEDYIVIPFNVYNYYEYYTYSVYYSKGEKPLKIMPKKERNSNKCNIVK